MLRCLVLKLVLVLAGSDLMVLACDSILSEMKIPSHKVNLLMALLGASFTGWSINHQCFTSWNVNSVNV